MFSFGRRGGACWWELYQGCKNLLAFSLVPVLFVRLLCKTGSLKWSRLTVSVFKWSFWWFVAQLVNSCISSPEKVLNCTFRMGIESCLKTGFSAGGHVLWNCILWKDQRESRGCCFHFMSEFIKIIIHNLFTSVGFSYITETDMWPFFFTVFFFFSPKTFMQLIINLNSARRKLHAQCLSKVLSGCSICSHCRLCVTVYWFCWE